MTMTRRLTIFAVLLAMVTALLVPTSVGAAQKKEGRTFAVTGQGTTPGSPGGQPGATAAGPVTFDGQFHVTRFVARQNQVIAIGELSGVVKDASGNTLRNVESRRVALPVMGKANAAQGVVAQQEPVCDILELILGPLHLDLLGLVIDLNQLILTIVAVPGAGNLLGNLLCAIAGLLDPAAGGTFAEAIAALLNAVIQILNSLGG